MLKITQDQIDTGLFLAGQDRRASWLLQPLTLVVYLIGALVGLWLGIDSMLVMGGVAGKLFMTVFLFAIPLVVTCAVSRPPKIALPIAIPFCFAEFEVREERFTSFQPSVLIRPPAI